jgi:hypothetical protein
VRKLRKARKFACVAGAGLLLAGVSGCSQVTSAYTQASERLDEVTNAYSEVSGNAQALVNLAEAQLIAQAITAESLVRGQAPSGKTLAQGDLSYLPGRYATEGLPKPVKGVVTLDSGCQIVLAKVVGGVNEVKNCAVNLDLLGESAPAP